MRKLFEKIHEFFAGLRNAEEEVRRRWFVILATASGVVVVAIGILSINATITPVSSPASLRAEGARPGVAKVVGAGAWESFRFVADAASSLWRFVRETVGAKQEINIELQKEEENFTKDDLAPVPPTSLP